MNYVVPLYGYLQLNANTPPGNPSDNESGSSIRSLFDVISETPGLRSSTPSPGVTP